MGFDSSQCLGHLLLWPFFDNSLLISLWGTPLISCGSAETDSPTHNPCSEMIQVVNEGTGHSLPGQAGRPGPGEKEKVPELGD